MQKAEAANAEVRVERVGSCAGPLGESVDEIKVKEPLTMTTHLPAHNGVLTRHNVILVVLKITEFESVDDF